MTIQLLWGAIAALPLTLPAETQSKTAEPAPAPSPEILIDLAAPTTLPLEGPISRHRTVAVRTELLADAVEQGTSLTLEPFPGERYQVRDFRVEQAWGGGQVYWGQAFNAEGEEVGSAGFSIFGDSLAASLRLDDNLFRIEPAGPTVFRVVQVDEFRMPGCGTKGESHKVPPTAPVLSGVAPEAAAPTNLPVVDILVAYTPAAKNGQGGTNGIKALINIAVSESNIGYTNSDVNQRYRLVHTAEMVGYVESSSFTTNLNRFRNKGDGYMDEVHTLRDQYGADANCLILNGGQYCGVAYGVMGFPTQSYQVNAFQVTARTCATGYYSFSHEFGHLFGSHHDKANAGNAYWPYGYGWRTANGAYRTVMAYAPGTRINWFSNPNKTFGGQTLGNPNTAENYRSLNNNASVVSQWRCAVPQNYCTSKTSSSWRLPRMGYLGKPFVGNPQFYVSILEAEPNKPGIVFYGYQTSNAPFMNGFLCVGGSVTRMGLQFTDTNGNAAFLFPIGQFTPGDEVYCQGWFRDPQHPDGTGTGLTNGLRIDVCQYNL